jgi:hypothetical protein
MGIESVTQLTKKPVVILAKSAEGDELIVELVKTLLKIDVNAPLAKLNATSISDNNGGRIEL